MVLFRLILLLSFLQLIYSCNSNKTEEEIMKHYVRDIPLKRPNNPEDIASMVVFLSSEGARNISGQSYNVDGGLIPS